MDVSPVSASPITAPSRPDAGTQSVAQAIPAVSAPASAPAAATSSGTSDTPSPDSLAQAVKQANESFRQNGQNLYAAFEKDKATGINVIKIVDNKTKETVSQIPIKEMVAFAQSLEHPQGMRGKLLHTTA